MNGAGPGGHRAAMDLTGGRGPLWGAIGVDRPLLHELRLLLAGRKSGAIVRGQAGNTTRRETVRQVREYAESGVRWIVLRTTEFYSRPAGRDDPPYPRAQVPGPTSWASTSGGIRRGDSQLAGGLRRGLYLPLLGGGGKGHPLAKPQNRGPTLWGYPGVAPEAGVPGGTHRGGAYGRGD